MKRRKHLVISVGAYVYAYSISCYLHTTRLMDMGCGWRMHHGPRAIRCSLCQSSFDTSTLSIDLHSIIPYRSSPIASFSSSLRRPPSPSQLPELRVDPKHGGRRSSLLACNLEFASIQLHQWVLVIDLSVVSPCASEYNCFSFTPSASRG